MLNFLLVVKNSVSHIKLHSFGHQELLARQQMSPATYATTWCMCCAQYSAINWDQISGVLCHLSVNDMVFLSLTSAHIHASCSHLVRPLLSGCCLDQCSISNKERSEATLLVWRTDAWLASPHFHVPPLRWNTATKKPSVSSSSGSALRTSYR